MQSVFNKVFISGIKHLLIKFTIDVKTNRGGKCLGKWNKMQNVLAKVEKQIVKTVKFKWQQIK